MAWMDKIVIQGGRRLTGSIAVGGSKNAVLPILSSTMLADGTYRIRNVPNLKDVRTMSRLLECMGVRVQAGESELTVTMSGVSSQEAPYDLVKTMRASIYVLGPLVARFGYAKVSLPGGCAWGPRPVNLHLEGLKKMGARIELEGGYIHARAGRLKSARIPFDIPSVGATCNLLMASVLAQGTTVIENAAREPEVESLVHFLVKMGARIQGAGTDRLEIEGQDGLHAAEVEVIPDRIETATFLAAAHLAGGEIMLTAAQPRHLTAVLEKLKESGAFVSEEENAIRLSSDGKPKPVDVTTAVYPGFPTDMQAQWMALMSIAGGSSIITETIFHDRFTHMAELRRLGADITLDHNTAVVRGVGHLSGAHVMSTDLRASASLIMAGLIARGRTDISRVYHIDRGYERIEVKLKSLGADIWREKEQLVT